MHLYCLLTRLKVTPCWSPNDEMNHRQRRKNQRPYSSLLLCKDLFVDFIAPKDCTLSRSRVFGSASSQLHRFQQGCQIHHFLWSLSSDTIWHPWVADFFPRGDANQPERVLHVSWFSECCWLPPTTIKSYLHIAIVTRRRAHPGGTIVG